MIQQGLSSQGLHLPDGMVDAISMRVQAPESLSLLKLRQITVVQQPQGLQAEQHDEQDK